jgi:hypothetical protein
VSAGEYETALTPIHPKLKIVRRPSAFSTPKGIVKYRKRTKNERWKEKRSTHKDMPRL